MVSSRLSLYSFSIFYVLLSNLATNKCRFYLYTGGVRGVESGGVYRGNEVRVDTQHCYACVEELKHPKDGTLYESGHHVDNLYGYL